MKWFWFYLIVGWFFWPAVVYGAELAEGTVRLSRQKTSTSPLPILVTVKTNREVIEDGFELQCGDGWIVNNPQISTVNLPAGVNVWPGLVQNQASDKRIDFYSSDLITNQVYGFYITEGISDNPEEIVEPNLVWHLATKSNGIIDAERYLTTSLSTNDQVAVTGIVGANGADFQLSLEASPSGVKKQNEQTDLVINYGSYLLNSTKPMVITVNWSKGFVNGAVVPTVNGLEYVSGSASQGYGGVSPVIDLANRTITWTMTTFPANRINEKVSFSLKNNESYTGSSGVSFEVKAVLDGANVVTVSDSTKINYLYYRLPNQLTPSVIQEVNSDLRPTTEKDGEMPKIDHIHINRINILSLLMDKCKIGVEVDSKPDWITINYGLGINSLTQKITSQSQTAHDYFSLENLKPDREYFFVITVKKNSQTLVSDVYKFKTAMSENKVGVDQNSLVVIADGGIVNDLSALGKSEIILPINKLYTIKINFSRLDFKEAEILVTESKNNVLGVNSVLAVEPSRFQSEVFQLVGNSGGAQLMSPATTGYYEIVLRIYEDNGSISQTKIANLRSINPILVTNAKDLPVEGATIGWEKLDERLRVYCNLPSQFKDIPNPSRTDTHGILSVPLPAGRYRLNVTAFGYKNKSVEARIGFNDDEIYPVISLESKPVSIADWISNYINIFGDVKTYLNGGVIELANSVRFFSLVQLAQVGLTGWLILMLIGKHYGISWWLVVGWIVNLLWLKKRKAIYGMVEDSRTGRRISGAIIYLGNLKLRSNRFGTFCLPNTLINKIKIFALGYYVKEMDLTSEAIKMNRIRVEMEKIDSDNRKLDLWRKEAFELVGGMVVLVLCMWQGLFLGTNLNFSTEYFILAIVDMVLWLSLVFMVEKRNVV